MSDRDKAKFAYGFRYMDKFMKIALNEARLGINSDHGGPFGAVVVRDGQMISKAHNEVLKRNDPTAHAEILAIRRASSALNAFALSDCEIYCTSEPCPMCFSAIYWARIKRLYYGTSRNDVSAIGFDDAHIYEIIKGQQLEDEQMETLSIDRDGCLELLQEWFAKPGRKLY